MKRCLRVLNEFDMMGDPLVNGLIAKKYIYELTESYLESKDRKYIDSMKGKEREVYIQSKMGEYIENHRYKLAKMYDKRTKEIRSLITGARSGDARKYVLFKAYLSTLNSHLLNGSSKNTVWISGTTSLEGVYKYYVRQRIHKVAYMDLEDNDYTLIVNLSRKEEIEKIQHILCRKIDEEEIQRYLEIVKYVPEMGFDFRDSVEKRTSLNFMGYNYATCDYEICVLGRVQPHNIINVFGALEIDMLLYGILDSKYLELGYRKQKEWLKRIRYVLQQVILKYDSSLMTVFDELYLQDKNEQETSLKLFSSEYMRKAKGKILRLARSVPDTYIKKG